VPRQIAVCAHIGCGVDGILTNYPAVLLKLLGRI